MLALSSRSLSLSLRPLATALLAGLMLAIPFAGASAQSAAGTDCGCTKTGAWIDPDPGQKPFVAANGDSAAANPTFRVIATPGPPNGPANVSVVPLAGGVPGASILSTTGVNWGFSPDQNRFLIWSITGVAPNTVVQADLWDLTTTPATHHRSFGGAFTSTRFRFSDDGRFLLQAGTAFGGTQIQLEWVKAATGDVRLATSFPVASPPGVIGDEFEVAGWGYGPDASRVVYAYVSGGLPVTAVDDLEDGSQAPVITAQSHISAFWQFSPCGDAFGVVNQRFATQLEVTAWKTRGGAQIGFTTFPIVSVTLSTSATHHQASDGNSTVDLGVNGSSAPCTNLPPTASFTVTGTLEAGQPIQFTDASTDVDGTIASWSWDFGDGGSSSSRNPVHTYAAGGSYDVVLTVTDDRGATHSATRRLRVCSAPTTPGGKILFRNGTLRGDLFALNPGSGSTVRITNGDQMGSGQAGGQATDGDWSPDGTKIAYVSENPNWFAGDGSGLVVANADGSNPHLIYEFPSGFQHIYSPRWTPDGRAIAFLMETFVYPNWVQEIHLIDADGTNLRGIGNASMPGGFSGVATCGPVGGRIPDGCWTLAVEASVTAGAVQVGRIQANGSGFALITTGTADYQPRFSPDGTKLVFTRGFAKNAVVYVANADGSNAIAVTSPASDSFDNEPIWSPDGTQIALMRNSYQPGFIHQRDIVVASADACHGTTVGTGSPYAQPLSWQSGTAVQGPGSISGHVFLGGASLVGPSAAGITVTVSWSGGSASAQTNSHGDYVVSNIPVGVEITSITASFPGWVWNWPGPLAGFGGHHFSNFTGHANGVYLGMVEDWGRLDGTVRDESGAPVAGVTLEITGGPAPVAPITTAADGRFSFVLRPQETYTIAPVTPGFDYTPSSAVTYTAYGLVQTQDFVAKQVLPPAVTPPVLFLSERDAPGTSSEIYAAEPDGSGAVRLTRSAENEQSPAWSPDGTRIAFVRELAGVPTLHVMAKDGTGVVSLGAEGTSPAWSPDGTQLAFARAGRIVLIDANGVNERELTFQQSGNDDHPTWTKDGRRVTFERFDWSAGNVDLFEVVLSTSTEAPFLVRAGDDLRPVWSPDGRTLAVVHDAMQSGSGELQLVAMDGITITPLGVAGDQPTFSADGRLAFTRDPASTMGMLGIGTLEIATASTGGFPASPGVESSPSWRVLASEVDSDADGVFDDTDVCRFTPNGAAESGLPGVGNQQDHGGVGRGTTADGIGDACQCGDVSGDGVVTLSDVLLTQRSLLDPPTATLARPEHCDVTGDGLCDLSDGVTLRRALLRPVQATIVQECAPAVLR